MEKFTQRETQQRTICDRYEKCECFECSDVACPSMTRPSQYYTSRDLAGPTHYDYKHEPPCITRTITFDYPSLPAPSAGRERGTTSQPTHLHQKSKYSHPTADGLIIHPKVNVPRRIPSCKTIEKDPNPEDVLFGRGGGTNRHAGNIFFRKIVADNQSQYVLAKKLEKAALAQEIVRKVHYQGGKFLRFNEKKSVWYEVTDKDAVLKASQALREGAARKLRETWKAVNGIPNSIVHHFNPMEEDESLWDLNLPGLG